ncbi:sensor histidine kinase [Nonomuraea sp. NPDC049269]|uniref:sensor histidine kinase n=1 Tax=Nonomuraea sp. NPDC049269 TaxID=3364349 RepID=UPI003720BBA7
MNDSHSFFTARLSHRQLIALDLLAGLGFSLMFLTASTGGSHLPPWARLALILGLGMPLVLRRIWPLPVFCLMLTLSIVVAVVLGVSFAYISPAYALYIVALGDARGAWVPTSAIGVLTLVTLVGMVVAGAAPQQAGPAWFPNIDGPLIGVAALGGAWTVGRAVRERRHYAARDAERLAEQAVTEERLRIARELHDVVAHSVGLIAVKAGVANHVMGTRPEEAHDALRVIETASRSALVEMRHLLGVLRSDETPDRGPAPDLGGLPGLAEQARLAGVEVELDLRLATGEGRGSGDDAGLPSRIDRAAASGAPAAATDGRVAHAAAATSSECADRGSATLDGADAPIRGGRPAGGRADGRTDAQVRAGRRAQGSEEGGAGSRGGEDISRLGVELPEGVELSVYRIVQEALTNVVKHAAPARCRVSVVADMREVRIEVIDDGPGRRTLPVEGTGHGLIGMRERVMMYDGVFEAGRLPGRGFRVSAQLPYGGTS